MREERRLKVEKAREMAKLEISRLTLETITTLSEESDLERFFSTNQIYKALGNATASNEWGAKYIRLRDVIGATSTLYDEGKLSRVNVGNSTGYYRAKNSKGQ